MTYQLKVPTAFFKDHKSRGCVEHSGEPHNYILKQSKTHYIVNLHIDDVIELLSDANHYASEWKQMGQEWFGLGMSARATKKAVLTQMVAQGYTFNEVA
jgi:hypothetical protein